MLGYRYELAKFEIDGWRREAAEEQLAHVAAEERRLSRASRGGPSSVPRIPSRGVRHPGHGRLTLHLGHPSH